MKTVKDVSEITGVSIRTLRYYDEIGLLKPTELTEAGYRLYNNKALERLREIMFFRELQIPLIDIKKSWIPLIMTQGTGFINSKNFTGTEIESLSYGTFSC